MNNLAININNAPAKSAISQPTGKDGIAQQEGQGFGNVLTRQVADSGKSAESSHSSSRGANSHATKQSAKKTDDKIDTDTTPTVDSSIADILPVDMLAALLAQQNLPADTKPQPEQNVQASNISSETEISITDAPAKDGINNVTLGAEGANIIAATGIASAATGIASAATGIASTATGIASTATDIASATTDKKVSSADSKNPLTTKSTSGNVDLTDSNITALSNKGGKVENAVKDNKELAEAFKASLGIKDAVMASDKQTLNTKTIGDMVNTVQQSAISAPVPSIATTSNPLSISTPVTQPAWGEEFSQKITWLVTQRNQSAELHLNPPQLGPLDVVLKINGDQATAMFTSSHAAVREAIEQAMPKLREMMADNGIMLGNATVSDQTSRNNQEGTASKATNRPALSDNNLETVNIQETRVLRTSQHNGMVDTFA